MRIVLDTNVLISALAFPGSKPDFIVFGGGRLIFDRVLREKFRFGKREARARVNAIRSIARLVQPAERITVITANDDDNRILECALAAQAEFLVTGDREHLLPLQSYRGTKIITPADFLDLLGPR